MLSLRLSFKIASDSFAPTKYIHVGKAEGGQSPLRLDWCLIRLESKLTRCDTVVSDSQLEIKLSGLERGYTECFPSASRRQCHVGNTSYNFYRSFSNTVLALASCLEGRLLGNSLLKMLGWGYKYCIKIWLDRAISAGCITRSHRASQLSTPNSSRDKNLAIAE